MPAQTIDEVLAQLDEVILRARCLREQRYRMKRSKTKLLLSKLLLVLGGLAAGCFIAEIGLRLIGYSYPTFYYRGSALRLSVEGLYRIEGGSYVRINSDGLRDREHTITVLLGLYFFWIGKSLETNGC